MKVIVGLSGGVDSAVSAYLLREQGYEVIGVTAILNDETDIVTDAKAVADYLGIEYRTVDYRNKFKKDIIDYFISEYAAGRTPNPCSMCNPLIKWEALMEVMVSESAEYVATGHYANIDIINDRYSIKNSVTTTKDQTYALALLSQEQLRHTIMPLGEYTKDKVREIALNAGLPVATKSDSQDICFVPDGDYAGFIDRNSLVKRIAGNFVTKGGKILGKHEGINCYTIGQRKGLNLAMGHPVFVTKIRPETNEVVIGESEDLFTTQMFVSNISFMGGSEDMLPKRLKCKVRYAHKGGECILEKSTDGTYKVSFEEAVRAITPGQTAVFYDGDYIFAGAVIN